MQIINATKAGTINFQVEHFARTFFMVRFKRIFLNDYLRLYFLKLARNFNFWNIDKPMYYNQNSINSVNLSKQY